MWWTTYNRIYLYHKKKLTAHQCYNTTWAYLGYTEDQAPEAVALATKLHADAVFQKFRASDVPGPAPGPDFKVTYFDNPNARPVSSYIGKKKPRAKEKKVFRFKPDQKILEARKAAQGK
jgi:hypothetical protein